MIMAYNFIDLGAGQRVFNPKNSLFSLRQFRCITHLAGTELEELNVQHGGTDEDKHYSLYSYWHLDARTGDTERCLGRWCW